MKQNKVFTIPNLLSLFRLLLIPVIVWLYRREQNHFLALLVLMLSGATDLADGYIARKWDLVSDLGKALDPIADKLTQIATLWCLLERFPHMCLPLAVLTVKEVFTGTMSLYAVKKSGQVIGADWHGKVCTAFLYGAMGLHPDEIGDLKKRLLAVKRMYGGGAEFVIHPPFEQERDRGAHARHVKARNSHGFGIACGRIFYIHRNVIAKSLVDHGAKSVGVSAVGIELYRIRAKLAHAGEKILRILPKQRLAARQHDSVENSLSFIKEGKNLVKLHRRSIRRKHK